MRILWLSHLIPYPPKGGVLQRSYNLLRETSRYHDIDLIAFNQKQLLNTFYETLEDGIEDARYSLDSFCDNIEFVPIKSDLTRYGKYMLALKSIFTEDPYTVNWLKSAEFINALIHMVKTYTYDLVHFDTISLVPYLKYIPNIPTVLDHHNIESHMLIRRANNENNIAKKWYFNQEGLRLNKIERNICPLFGLNITCSSIDKVRLMDIAPGSRIEVIPNGVDTDYFKQDTATQQDMSLIFVGRLNWYPNIEAVQFIAHKIWPALMESNPNIHIDIIGANPPDDVKKVGDKYSNFRVHGFVDDIRPYINKAAIYICPINDGGGTKLKILDAFSMGKAVIAHPIACEGINVQEGKNVLFAQTPDEYINLINKLIGNESLRSKLGMEARYLIEQEYAYRMIGERLSSLYIDCINRQ